MTLPPRISTSPVSPGATSCPDPSTTRNENPGRGRPTVVAIVSASSSGPVAAAVPPSVSPYPVMIVENGSSASMRRISSTGMSAAPVTATRRLERSKLAAEGWSRSDWYSVGGPGSTVIRSSPTRASTRSTSKTGSGNIVAPAVIDARMPALSPNMWK